MVGVQVDTEREKNSTKNENCSHGRYSRLSPHTTSIAGEGKKPTVKNCLQFADKAGISSKVGMDIFREVQDAVSYWPDIAAQVGVSGKACPKIASTLEKI